MLTVHTANDFMRRELVTLSPDTPLMEGVNLLLKHRITGAPVVSHTGEYLGVFSEKCCFKALLPRVDACQTRGAELAQAPSFMAKELLVLRPEADVFESIDKLLAKRVSGAPVLDAQGQFQGSFSEKTAMRVLVTSAYDGVPGGVVGSYMNPDQRRIIDEHTSVLDATERFRTTPYRRLPVLRAGTLLGQVSRRDVLLAGDTLVRAMGEEASDKVVGDFMDNQARTIEPGADLLTMAQIFEDTPYRRLPVLEGQQLAGQVSRRDVLRKAAEILRPAPERHHAEVLYLSPLLEEAPPELQP